MLRIWGRVNSVNAQKVLWCADELGLTYQRIEAGLEHGVVDTPHYREMNPNGRIPVIDHDGFVMWESNAIVRYLCRTWGQESLLPQGTRAQADADRWMDWVATMLGPAISPAFWGTVRTPLEERNLVAIEASRKATADLFAILDEHLASREFVGGERFSMADVPVGTYAHRWLAMDIQKPDHPNVARWYRELGSRQPYRTRVMLPLS